MMCCILYIDLLILYRCVSRTSATSDTEFLVTLINDWKPFFCEKPGCASDYDYTNVNYIIIF